MKGLSKKELKIRNELYEYSKKYPTLSYITALLGAKLRILDGEMILLEKKEFEVDNKGISGMNYLHSPVYQKTKATLEAGIISKPYIFENVQKFDIQISVKNKAKLDPIDFKGTWEKSTENFIIAPIEALSLEFREFSKYRRPQNDFGPGSGTYLEYADLRVGNKEVKEYFKNCPLNSYWAKEINLGENLYKILRKK